VDVFNLAADITLGRSFVPTNVVPLLASFWAKLAGDGGELNGLRQLLFMAVAKPSGLHSALSLATVPGY